MDYQNAEFYKLNKNTPDLIYNFTDERIIYRKEGDGSGGFRIVEYKGNVGGSLAEYSFHYKGDSEDLFVFEAPIDMLAFISMHKSGWQKHSYVALCSTADRAALQMLKDDPTIKTVYLCLDNDNAGELGCERIAKSVHAHGDYTVYRMPPMQKDWDEDLKALHGREHIPSAQEQTM